MIDKKAIMDLLITRDNCMKIIHILKKEIPNYQKQLSNYRNIAELREILHGLVGAFHFTGAISVKQLIKNTQKICKDPNSSNSQIEEAVTSLVAEISKLKVYLETNTIEF